MQKVFEEKISDLNAVQQEKQRLFEHRVAKLEKKSNINWIAVLMAIATGILIGYLIKV